MLACEFVRNAIHPLPSETIGRCNGGRIRKFMRTVTVAYNEETRKRGRVGENESSVNVLRS